MIHLPQDWPAEIQLAIYQAAARAEAVLTASDAGAGARRIFWKVFRQRIVWGGIRLEQQEGIMSRKRLAQIGEVSERAVSSALAFLRREGMVFWGIGKAHRFNTPLLVDPKYLAQFPKLSTDLSTGYAQQPRPGSRLPVRHYKDLPQRRSGVSEDSLYSDAAASQASQTAKTATTARRRGTGPREAVYGARQLAREFLRGLSPPPAPS